MKEIATIGAVIVLLFLGNSVAFAIAVSPGNTAHNSFAESGLRQTSSKTWSKTCRGKAHLFMKTAAEYRAMAEECFRWARQARTSEMRVSLRQLAHIWLDAASNLDGLPPTRTQTTAREQRSKLTIKERATA